MAGYQTATDYDGASSHAAGTKHTFSLVVLTSLFFMWGFITCLNDILIPHLKNVFDLSYFQSMLIQFCFFGAYFIVSIPAGTLVKRIGYQKGIVAGLLLAGVGCTLFYPAASMQQYPLFLGALFVLASGITILQVSANPYVAALGNPATASSRLNLTQAFNSLGTTLAPFFGAFLILSVASVGFEQMSVAEQLAFKAEEAEAVQAPYLLLAFALMLLAGVFSVISLPQITEHQQPSGEPLDSGSVSAWKRPHLVLGALGIFVYVGAEVSIGSFLVSFLTDENVAGMTIDDAAHYIAYYWGGAMVGRFIGAAILHRVAAGKMLAFNALAAITLIVVAVLGSGNLAMISILLVGLFNSIMFPTIFTLAVDRLGASTSQGSGILCLAIVGGAVLPLLQGLLADAVGVQLSFVMPIVCYAYIVYYGWVGAHK